ncbi:TetR/AcrR family transcriptional regulator [Streptomyces sp. NPDC093568]|uniref:TetR/AcrR family transcriptional regulator n=1 Tax=Streptomyces sp. NPDC093568 TaxID=3366041 RepID=UPI0038189036
MEIARAAAALFVRRGLRATRAEDIAQAAGIAPRTFYRYFATKEEAVAPLYAAGAARWTQAVRDAPADLPLPEALEHAARHTLTPGTGVSAASWDWVRTLVRLATSSPALRRVWAEVCHESEDRLAEVLVGRGRSGHGGERGGGERTEDEHAGGERGGDEHAGGERGDNVAEADRRAIAETRFAAAVAAAAVRVAVESWAAGNAPAQGPDGPAALALANLGALRDFPWDDIAVLPRRV